MRPDDSYRDSLFPSVDMGDFIKDTWTKIRRQWTVLAALFVISLLGSVYYVLTATPLYTANGAILIDPRTSGSSNLSGQGFPGIAGLDALVVDSELRILGSREITTQTMLELGYGEVIPQEGDEVAGPSMRRRIENVLGLSQGPQVDLLPEAAETLRAARDLEALRREFVQGLDIRRAGESYVVDITYTSPDVVFASEAVNALIREYLRASGEQQVSQVQQTRDWLSERIAALEISVRDAETAVAEYRSQNEALGLQNELSPTEIALSKGVEDLITLRGQVLLLDVQVQKLTEQIASGVIEEVQVPTNERTPALIGFQAGYAELLREEQELLSNWSDDSPLVVATRERQDQLRRLILDEYSQVRSRLASRRDTLRQQAEATETVMDELRVEYSGNIRQAVELRNLEREAEAERQLYDQMLEEFVSSSQLLTLETDIARVIAWAVPPDRKSAPQSRQIVVLAVFGAMFLGLSFIILRELLDGRFRTYDQIEKELGVPSLGLIPQFQTELRHAQRSSAGRHKAVDSKLWKQLSKQAQRLLFTAKWPYSITAETMRSVQSQLDMDLLKTPDAPACPVVGFASTSRDEGKTVAAFNFASSIARQQKRVAIVDLDLMSLKLTSLVGPVLPKENQLAGLLESPENAVISLQVIEDLPNLAVIGNSTDAEINITLAEDFEAIQRLIEGLRVHFDLIVLDLPAVQGVSDVRQLTSLCDKLVYLVRWGATTRDQVRSVFKRGMIPKEKVLGVLYSRAPLKRFRSYNPDGLIEHYY